MTGQTWTAALTTKSRFRMKSVECCSGTGMPTQSRAAPDMHGTATAAAAPAEDEWADLMKRLAEWQQRWEDENGESAKYSEDWDYVY